MKKKVKLLIIFAAVLLICSLCPPIICEAQNVSVIDELFLNPEYDFNDAVYQLFKDEEAVSILANTDSDEKDLLMGKLSEEELYKLMLMYRYSLVSETVSSCIRPERGDTRNDGKSIKEKIEKELEFYGELVKRLREAGNQSGADTKNDEKTEKENISEIEAENQAEAEAGQTDVESGNQAETDSGSQDGTSLEQSQDSLHKVWEHTAFMVFRETVMANQDDFAAEAKEVNDFEDYAEYLIADSDCNIAELMQILGHMQEIDDSGTEQVMEEAKALLYHIYTAAGADQEEEAQKKDDDKEKEDSEQQDKARQDHAQASPAPASAKADTSRAGRPANAVARIGSTYYTTFNSAFNALPSGGTLYVLRDCEATHIVTTKSFSIYPEERNVKVTFRESSLTPAGIICTPAGTGSPTWTIGGKDGYTITFDANQKGSSGVLSCHKADIHLKNGVRLTNARGNGVWNDSGTTNVYDGAWIYNNGSHGIATLGTINIYGGKIYGNKYDGMRSQKAINVSGGEIYNNQECGVHVGEGSCTFTMTGGTIHDNIIGVGNMNGQGTIQISAGEIYGNKQDGIYTLGRQMTITGTVRVHDNARSGVVINGGTASITGGSIFGNPVSGIVNKGTLHISGGSVYANTAESGGGIQNYGSLSMSGGSVSQNQASGSGGGICLFSGSSFQLSGGTIRGNAANSGKGVYHNGEAMKISGNGMVDAGNDVYLGAGKFVSVTGRLNGQLAAVLTPSDYRNGRKAAEYVCEDKKGSTCFQQFRLTPNSSYCLRPGDYQASQSGARNEDIVLSTRYRVSYHKNIEADIKDVPGETDKYWYEAGRLSSLTPSSELIKFRGWSENMNAEKAEFQPGDELNASINKAVTLYAVWKTKIKINYIGIHADDVKADFVTMKECLAAGGYTVRKNAEFTKYERSQSSFAGWDIASGVSGKNVKFPEDQTCVLTYGELLELSAVSQGSDYSNEDTLQEINLYAVWDEAPVISASDAVEFYEGTEVTKDMLLENVKAADREDGDISEHVRIIQIHYADGKVVGGEKQKGQTDVWRDDMPGDYKLDTWFMQMDPEDSPVIHKITYAVTDSFGNETKYEWTVKVKYNEFPEIEAEDWYFTLEEAKAGVITEEQLLKDAVLAGRVKAYDAEDDELYPGKIQENIRLSDFHEEDFVTFEESGYLVITYNVKDSMGPQGEGKETFRQCMVHILKDGEVIEPEPVKYVRFINQEYYEKNLNSVNDKNGGLSADSKWYRDPEYRETITGMWAHDGIAEEVWKFDENDVRKVKDYVKKHGIGNSVEENALEGFTNSFGYARK